MNNMSAYDTSFVTVDIIAQRKYEWELYGFTILNTIIKKYHELTIVCWIDTSW